MLTLELNLSETPLTTRLVVEGKELLETQGLVVSRWLEPLHRAPTQVPATNKGRCPKNRAWGENVFFRGGLPPPCPVWPGSFLFRVAGSLSWSCGPAWLFSFRATSQVPFLSLHSLAAGVVFQLPAGERTNQTQGHRPKHRPLSGIPLRTSSAL